MSFEYVLKMVINIGDVEKVLYMNVLKIIVYKMCKNNVCENCVQNNI